MRFLSDKTLKIAVLVLFGASIALPMTVLAADTDGLSRFTQLQYPDWFNLSNLPKGQELTALIAIIFKAFLILSGIAAFIMIVVGGFKYLTSVGNPGIMSDARNQIFSALLGLVLLFSSYLILNTLNPELVELKEPELAGMTGPPPSASPGQIIIEVIEPIGVAKITFAANASSPDMPLSSSGLTLKADGQARKITITGGTTEWTTPIQDGSVSTTIIKADGSTVLVKLNIGIGTSAAAASGVAAMGHIQYDGTPSLDEDRMFFEKKITGDWTYEIKALGITIATLQFDVKKNEVTLRVLAHVIETKTLEGDKVELGVHDQDISSWSSLTGKLTLTVTLHLGKAGFCDGSEDSYDVVLKGGGESRCFNAGDEKAWKVSPKDILSVVINKTGSVAVKLFQEADFGGKQICFTTKLNPTLSTCKVDERLGPDVHWDNNVNSLRVIRPAECPTPKRTLTANGTPTDNDKDKCN